jgi:thiamine-monophosphate kinase
MAGVDVEHLGEFGLIERLIRLAGGEASSDLIVGPGDDAAVWRAGGEFLLATTDTVVEGVHFLPNRARWQDVGWKVLAANVGDIAAMGGTPLFALVTLALPRDSGTEQTDALYEGLGACARKYGIAIAGGDVVRAPQVSVTVALIGRAEQREGEPLLLRRCTARAGDCIGVTGTLGDSAGGLRRMREGAGTEDPLVRRHMRPAPPVETGRAAVLAGLRCGIDVSDGLMQDVGHLCEASHVRALVRGSDLPLSNALLAAYRADALELACTGGEDYELVLAGPRETLEALPGVTVIGVFEEGPPRVTVLGDSGGAIKFERGGWDAFRS